MPALYIASLTVRDLLRRRVLVILGLFAVGMILLSFPLRELTIGQWQRLISDVGLGASDLSISLIAILLGATLIAGDIDRRTVYPILAKPVSRTAFVVGRYLGLACVLVLLAIAMSIGTDVVLAFAGHPQPVAIAEATAGIAVSGLLVAALSVMFSSFTSATLAGTYGLSMALICHLNDNLAYFAGKSASRLTRALLVGVARGLPNLEQLNLKSVAALAAPLPWSHVLPRLLYGATYSAFLVAAGALIFSRRDLK